MDWEKTKIKDLCLYVISGGTPLTSRSDFYIDGTIPWLKTTEVHKEFIYEADNFITEAGLQNSSAKLIPANSVIVAMYGDGGTAGKCAVNKIPLCTNQACCNLVIDESKTDYRFIYYSLKINYQNLVNLKLGGSQQNLNSEVIKNFEIPTPPLPIQRRIAEILGRYDALIENYTAQIRTLEASAQNLYREWFIRFRISDFGLRIDENTKLPVGWEKKKFTDVVSILSGGTPKTDNPNYWNGDVFWFSPADLQNSFYVMSTSKTITETGLKNCNSKLYPKNTVVITARGTVGKCVLLGAPMAINQSNYALVGKNISQFFVYLKSLELTSKWKQEAIGAVFETITVDNFERTEIILPSNDILLKFEKIVTPIFAKMENLQNQITKLRQMRDKLLPRLLSGNIEFKV